MGNAICKAALTTALLLTLSWASPAAGAVDANFNADCCPGLASCCNEDGNWCLGQTCGPAETSEEEAGVCTRPEREFLDDHTVCARMDQSQEPSCVIRSDDVSCQDCSVGEICYLDGRAAGTCTESEGRKNCALGAVTGPPPTGPTSPPDLTVRIPGLNLSQIRTAQEGPYRVYEIPWIADYITGAYRYAVFAGAVLAAVMLMIGGLQWLTAAGDSGRVAAAKKRIANAIIGLILVLGSYVMLVSINPDLAQLQPMRIKVIERSAYSVERELLTTTEDTSGEAEE